MENNKNKKSVKFHGDMLNFCDFIQVFVFTRNHHLNILVFSVKKIVSIVYVGLPRIECKSLMASAFIKLKASTAYTCFTEAPYLSHSLTL